VWKVALDVPDAEDLMYQRDGDRMLVVQEDYEASDGGFVRRLPDGDMQATDVLPKRHQGAIDALLRTGTAGSLSYGRRGDLGFEKRATDRAVVVDIVLLVLAVVAGWTVVHFALY